MISFRTFFESVTTAFDIDWQAEYQKYNVELFDGILPVIPIELKNIKPHGVCISYHYKRGKLRVNRTLSKICISTRYKQTHEQFMNTLIHEMIHAWLCVKQVPEREHHGLEFKSKMYALRKLGYNIDVHAEEGEIAIDNKKVYVVFLVEKLKAERNKYIMVTCSPKNSDVIKKLIVKRYMWEPNMTYQLESTDNELLKYPTARTAPKYYVITKELFDSLKAGGKMIDQLDNSVKEKDPNV